MGNKSNGVIDLDKRLTELSSLDIIFNQLLLQHSTSSLAFYILLVSLALGIAIATMHGLKTPTFLGLRSSSRPASPAPTSSPPATTPVVSPTARPSTPITPLDLSESIPRRPLAKLHLPAAFRRASPSPSPAPTPIAHIDKPAVGSNYLNTIALRISEAASKAIAPPTPIHNSDGLVIDGRRPLPAGRGRILGQLITAEMTSAAQGGSDLLRASLRGLHRPLNVLLSNVNALLAPLVVTAPTNVLAPTSGWVGNGAVQAHALGLATMVGEVLEALEGLPGDCAKVGGEGLRSTKEGLEGVVKRVVNPVLSAMRVELGALIDALELVPEAGATGKKDKGEHAALGALHHAMPCAIRVLGRIAGVPGSAVRGALAAWEIAIVWRAMVALAHRRVGEPVRQTLNDGSPTKATSASILGKSQSSGKSHSLSKTQSLGSIGSSAVPASLTKRLTPPNTPPAGRFGLLLPPSRPASPPGLFSNPAVQLAHDAQVVFSLFDALPKPAGDDAREAVVEAFDALRAFTELLILLSAIPLNPQAIINLVDGEPDNEPNGRAEREELPALIVLPALLRGKSVAAVLEIGEAQYRERCLAGFGRAEASEDVVVKAVLASGLSELGPDKEWVKGWLAGRAA